VKGEEIFQTIPELTQFSQEGQTKSQKKHKLDPKVFVQIFFNHLATLPSIKSCDPKSFSKSFFHWNEA